MGQRQFIPVFVSVLHLQSFLGEFSLYMAGGISKTSLDVGIQEPNDG